MTTFGTEFKLGNTAVGHVLKTTVMKARLELSFRTISIVKIYTTIYIGQRVINYSTLLLLLSLIFAYTLVYILNLYRLIPCHGVKKHFNFSTAVDNFLYLYTRRVEN